LEKALIAMSRPYTHSSDLTDNAPLLSDNECLVEDLKSSVSTGLGITKD
jgi:hypothetical protein